jgi:ATP-binding cassette subfamily B protein RaxB
VNLNVAPGETVAVVGPSGCGKTTLIKVLLGLLPPTEGEVRVNGRNLADWDLRQYRARDRRGDAGRSALRRHHRGQHQLLRHRARSRARPRVRARAMIDEEIMAMPMQYNTIVGSLGMALSGGRSSGVIGARIV